MTETTLSNLDLDEIRRTIDGLIEAHERWLAIIADHRAAIARSDARAGERCTTLQQEIMAEIAELETKRQDLLQLAALERARFGAGPLTITELAEHAPEPDASALRQRADRLRALIETARKDQEALALAAGALAAHMEGLVRQVVARLNTSATYAPHRPATPVSAGVDITQ